MEAFFVSDNICDQLFDSTANYFLKRRKPVDNYTGKGNLMLSPKQLIYLGLGNGNLVRRASSSLYSVLPNTYTVKISETVYAYKLHKLSAVEGSFHDSISLTSNRAIAWFKQSQSRLYSSLVNMN